MTRTRSNYQSRPQQGGVTIFTVLALLVLATVVAFSMGRNSIRELMISGTAWQAAKASEASEAGLDWFLLWANKSNWGIATDRGRNTFVQQLQVLSLPGWQNRPDDYALNVATKAWDRASKITSTETDAASDMVFSNAATNDDFLQASTGNVTIQSFDIAFRYLGSSLVQTTSSTGGQGTNLNLFQVRSMGKASVPTTGTGYLRFTATREMFATTIP